MCWIPQQIKSDSVAPNAPLNTCAAVSTASSASRTLGGPSGMSLLAAAGSLAGMLLLQLRNDLRGAGGRVWQRGSAWVVVARLRAPSGTFFCYDVMIILNETNTIYC